MMKRMDQGGGAQVPSSSASAAPIWQGNGVELQRTRNEGRKLELAAWRKELTAGKLGKLLIKKRRKSAQKDEEGSNG